ncbi:MAG: SDR family NAD(P)-dependent oxidoreductase [Acidobacteria bacterium]|nr:SDR family NAD(P)-dependent oxidoreductase [Acidobacteriota bacterium]
MMAKTILITGGAGFIGSRLADELLEHGCRVRALDCLAEQVHGPGMNRPSYLNPEVELVVGDVRDPSAVRRALAGVDAVYHFAATVGVGQSMYEISRYVDVNNCGTAVLLQVLIERPVERLIVASSMSVYGEGLYRRPDGTVCSGVERNMVQLKARRWELVHEDGGILTPIPTPENKTPSLASIYALSKYDQEKMCLLVGNAYGMPAVALRFFNVYGPRQSLSNPYTGVLAIFASRLLNGNPPLINEDGFQMRDFVSVHDVAQACRLALQVPEAAGKIFNIGSGTRCTIREVALRMAAALGKEEIEPRITNKYRVGDIRHCFADISHARAVLKYKPGVKFEEGIRELAGWLERQIALDRGDQAHAELDARGLTV